MFVTGAKSLGTTKLNVPLRRKSQKERKLMQPLGMIMSAHLRKMKMKKWQISDSWLLRKKKKLR